MPYADIIGIGSYLPERVLTNADLEAMVNTSDEWITTRTGIRERRLAAEGEATSHLAIEASRRAMADAGIGPGDIDLIIIGTSSPDMLMPSTACLVQVALGMTCPAYDVNAACSGFVYGLHAAAATIESGRARTVLLAGADALSRFVDFSDRTTCVLFGDGAGAVVLRAGEEPGVMAVELGADGTGADALKIPAGGSAMPVNRETVDRNLNTISMNGGEVYKFAVRAIPKATRHVMERSGIGLEDLAWLIPHQANQRIIGTIGEALGIEPDRVFSHIDHTGNTSAASIPLALDDLYTAGRLHPGDHLAIVGFGAGLTWGAAVIRWTKEAL
jgi:3-oxoacyl-[acyl-carrier-protein] synthase-3